MKLGLPTPPPPPLPQILRPSFRRRPLLAQHSHPPPSFGLSDWKRAPQNISPFPLLCSHGEGASCCIGAAHALKCSCRPAPTQVRSYKRARAREHAPLLEQLSPRARIANDQEQSLRRPCLSDDPTRHWFRRLFLMKARFTHLR
eukprot:6205679-Pleurochrysis_carterae.AAC.4